MPFEQMSFKQILYGQNFQHHSSFLTTPSVRTIEQMSFQQMLVDQNSQHQS